ncbi:excinuclease ABC subunit A, partial [Candidatus Gottesmanbacteria bacterium]|nr:excinuclease ABC subunit A [Candidatus Gottesmanbacteria bacterium]
EISKLSSQQITDNTISLIKNLVEASIKKLVRLVVLSPLVRDRKGEFKELFENLKSKGYSKVRADGQIFNLENELILIKTNKHTIEAVIDRLTIDKKQIKDSRGLSVLRTRLADSIEQALLLSEGLLTISEVKDAAFEFPDKPKKFIDHIFSERFACPNCNISLPEIEPRVFSFNSPHGACPTCSGIGSLLRIDPARVINYNLSINEGGILPFARQILSDTWFGRILLTVAQSEGIRLNQALKNASISQIKILLYGTGDKIHQVIGENRYGRQVTIQEKFAGIVGELEKRYSQTESEFIRNEIAKYLKEEVCPACLGKRLKKEALAITVGGKSIVDITSKSIIGVIDWVNEIQIEFSSREKSIASLIIREISSRLLFLVSVGLEYLTLDRSANTLAAGEAQRIRLASQIGSGLSGVLYVLDEPSIGLHPRDNSRLIFTLKKLRDLGNSVIVVEHDREMIENADLVIDFGPGAGEHGGKIIAAGSLQQIKNNPLSLTGQYLADQKIIKIASGWNISIENHKLLNIEGCSQNNLKNIDVAFPLNRLICISGVSGSGKSTLIVDTLYQALQSHFNPYYRGKVGKYRKLDGTQYIRRVILIDQSPIGRTPRSNPATYTGAFSYIREMFAQTPEARIRGYKTGRFSFNVKGGRCEACAGDGQTKIEMQFMPDVYVTCDVCNGTRFNNETLEVRFKEKNIADVLQMTVEKALNFFVNIPGLVAKLETLYSVGLSYIHLGQPAPQLSGGEAQRVKLATELSKKNSTSTFYILDEPTTGLHFADLEKLLYILGQLVAAGNTVLVIEHNLDVLKNADWIIDLGPEGGQNGGSIIAQGTPKQISANPRSYTGKFLSKII